MMLAYAAASQGHVNEVVEELLLKKLPQAWCLDLGYKGNYIALVQVELY